MKKIIFYIFILFVLEGCFLHKKTVTTAKRQVSFKFYFSEAEKNYMLENYTKAEEYYKGALAYNSTSAASYYGLSRLSFINSDLPQAKYYISKATELNPSNLWYWRFSAKLDFALHKPYNAIDTYEKHIIPNSSYPFDYYTLISFYDTVGRYTSLLKTVEQLRKIEGVTVQNFLIAVEAYSKMYDTVSIADEYEKMLEIYPNNEDLILMYANLLIDWKNYERLKTLINNAKQVEITDNKLFLMYAYYYSGLGRGDSAFLYIKKALQAGELETSIIDNFFDDQKTNLTYDNFGNYLDSIYFVLEEKNIYTPAANEVFVKESIEKKKYYFLETVLENSFASGTATENYIEYLCRLYLRLNEFEKLNAFTDTTLIEYPFNLYLYYHRAIYFLHVQEPDMASVFVNSMIKKNTGDFTMKVMSLYLNYLIGIQKTGRRDTALLNDFFSQTPLDCNTKSYLAYLNFVTQTDYKTAETYFEGCDSSKNADIFYIHAMLEFRRNQFKQAMTYVKKAIELSDVVDFGYYELAYFIALKLSDNQAISFYKEKAEKYGSKFRIFSEF